ncbi:MAG: NAD(P)H-binding protein [Planctomycetes bacterium]|nr:NAD(P)H-binding protein [Planctomycetota bacterium]
MNQQDSPVLVLGATGKTGRRVVDRLRARGRPVRAGSRRSTTPFDWQAPATWAPALAGADAVYVSFFPDLAVPEAPTAIEELVAIARGVGVRRLVLLSGRGEANARRCEAIVGSSGLSHTIVRASWFDQNFDEGHLLGGVLDGIVAMPADRVREPFVDCDDIADVAVAALCDDGHDGELYEVTGPRLLTFADAVAAIARASGRELDYLPISLDDFRTALAADAGPALANLLTELCREVLDGRNESLGDGVERALGRAPRDFADWARGAAATGVWAQR